MYAELFGPLPFPAFGESDIYLHLPAVFHLLAFWMPGSQVNVLNMSHYAANLNTAQSTLSCIVDVKQDHEHVRYHHRIRHLSGNIYELKFLYSAFNLP